MDREVIGKMFAQGNSRTAIAEKLQCHRTAVGRELKRNADTDGEYFPSHAQATVHRRRSRSKQPWKMEQPNIAAYVFEKLLRYWSPQQIAGRMPLDHPHDPAMRISHACIYAEVYRLKAAGMKWHSYLRQAHRKRRKSYGTGRKRGQIVGRVGIENRPPEVETRSSLGHWESDTVEGAGRASYLVTHVERKSRYLVTGKIADKCSATFNAATVRAFARHDGLPLATLTADNGKEFAAFGVLEKKLGLAVYFADPYHSWQRGTNENTNGLLRQFFPKGLDLRGVSHGYVAHVERLLNNRPRKCLDYRTPKEVITAQAGP
jgi:IS30 family transposase